MTVNHKRHCNHARLFVLTVFFSTFELSCCFLHGGIVTAPSFGFSNFESRHRRHVDVQHNLLLAAAAAAAASISLETYQHKDFKLTYLYKPPAPGRENDDPIVMIHPVGVGLSSWFWTRVMESYKDNPPMYAPDLIGCGMDHGADPWYPDKVGLFFPLSWVEGIETLLQDVIQSPSSRTSSSSRSCLVVCQGGLAPVGIMLAARNNPDSVRALMLTSPPTYQDITTAVPQAELQRNYKFLQSPIWGNLAFSLLETRAIIRFFSNLFLFSETCDEEWLDETDKESQYPEGRTPIQAFNAGLLQHRSFETELQEATTRPLMIVSGVDDKRAMDRTGYAYQESSSSTEKQKKCQLKTLEGTNVLPWENPNGIVELINEMGF